MEYRPTRGNIRALLRSRQIGVMLERTAQPIAARIRADTPVSRRPGGGGTMASTTVEPHELTPDGSRQRVRITQAAYTGRNRPRGGAAAPLQFGNSITRQRSHMTRGLQGGGQ